MNVLGIETSCDETAAAVVTAEGVVRSNVVYSQIAAHRPYGGVVPEIACRAHTEVLPDVIREALSQAGVGWDGIDALAVTNRPGLASSLLVGLTAAKALALRTGRPLIPVNHLEAHLVSAFLGEGAPTMAEATPAVVLLVSGGHTSLLHLESPGRYRLLGQTLDDAAGEALDKGAKLLGLGYPGGPVIEKTARGGRPDAVRFPRGEVQGTAFLPEGLNPAFCFSFSGLKTALLYYLKDHPDAREGDLLRDVTASYQEAVVDALVERVARAAEAFPVRALACGGGVARNRRLRERLETLATERGLRLLIAQPAFCTDNAAMVAAVAASGLARPAEDLTALDVQPTAPLGIA